MKHVLPRLLRPVAPGVTRPSWVGGEEGVWSLVCNSCITAMISSGHELSRLRAAIAHTNTGYYHIAGKFGGLVVYITTAKISYSHISVWRSRNKPPNLNQLIFLQ